MKIRILGVAALGLAACASLSASSNYRDCCDPCCNPCPSFCCGSFEVGGQAIYLRPTSCDYGFVIKDDRPYEVPPGILADLAAQLPSGKNKGIDPDYEWGFRVSLGYIMDCSCRDVRVEYTYHHPTDSFTVFGSETLGLWPTFMHPRYTQNFEVAGDPGIRSPLFTATVNSEFIEARATSKVKLDYDAVDLQFGSRKMKGCNLCIRTYAGLHFMNLDHKHEAQYIGVVAGPFIIPAPAVIQGDLGAVDNRIVCTRQIWGIGPLFGVDARYCVACGFGIGGHLGAAVLAGEKSGKYFEHDTIDFQFGPSPDTDEEATVIDGSTNTLFPYIRGSLGINYLWCCSCFNVLAEVGYEFNSYINTIGYSRFDDERGTKMGTCNSYNLNGLYISVRATI